MPGRVNTAVEPSQHTLMEGTRGIPTSRPTALPGQENAANAYFWAGGQPFSSHPHLLPKLINRMELLALIKECKQERVTAQKYLYDRFATQLFLVARRYVKSDVEAEEVLQNGFLKIFQHLPQFMYSSDGAFVAWMKKIIVNECLQELRKKNSFLIVAEEHAQDSDITDDVLGRLSAQDIYRFITKLPIGYRTVFNLYAVEGYSHAEIAGILNITEGTSKSQLSKARKTLQLYFTQNNLYAGREAK